MKRPMQFWKNIMERKNLMMVEKMAKMPRGSKLIYNPSMPHQVL